MTDKITPEHLLNAYASGVFPMAESADDDEVFWVEPHMRGIIPLDQFHISRSLKAYIKKGGFDVRLNHDFSGTVSACANRKETWINPTITMLYDQLHKMGFAHSVEVYRDNKLIGGVYGVTLGSAFFGESMFSNDLNGSKIALTYLVALLKAGGFTLFDTQFQTDHLASLGAIEISKDEYKAQLQKALTLQGDILRLGELTPQGAIQASTQTS